MLEIRPNCELCDVDLPVDSTNAFICTYECTFCRDCVDNKLKNVCPNCGGGFSRRPIRPKVAHRQGLSSSHQVASLRRINTKYSLTEIEAFSNQIKHIDPKDR